MILFRDEEVFRVALNNAVEKQTSTLVAIRLNKIGMKVRGVNYSNENLKNSKYLHLKTGIKKMKLSKYVLLLLIK